MLLCSQLLFGSALAQVLRIPPGQPHFNVHAAADVLDAMSSDRPWRPAFSFEEAMDFVRGHAGSLFDPAVVDALTARRERVQEIHALLAPQPAG